MKEGAENVVTRGGAQNGIENLNELLGLYGRISTV